MDPLSFIIGLNAVITSTLATHDWIASVYTDEQSRLIGSAKLRTLFSISTVLYGIFIFRIL